MVERCDVVIAGARLAGACAAAHLAKAGRRVVVLDKSKFPSDQLSTHLLMPAGVDELRRMGALEGILAHGPTLSRQMTLTAPDGVVVHERWRKRGETDYAMCVPRPIQDLELVNAARAAGADVRERCTVTEVLWRAGRAAGVRYRDSGGEEHTVYADLVLGADGRRSAIAQHVGAFEPYRSSKNGRGLVFRYVDDPQHGTQAGETIYTFREGGGDGTGFAFAFPSCPAGRILVLFMGSADEVAGARKDPEGYWSQKLAQHPELATRLEGATNMSKLRSTGDTSAYFRASSGPGWALLGDAGHFKDPVIGQGQRDALWSGRALAEAVAYTTQSHAATDIALRNWEQERDRECLHAYHFGNIETEIRTVSPVLTELLRHVAGGDGGPDVGDLFNRGRTMTQVLSLSRLARGLGMSLRRRSTHGSVAEVVPDALADLTVHIRVRADLAADRFRSTRLVRGSEHPGAHPPVPAAPAGAAPQTAAPAGASAVVDDILVTA